MSMLPVLYNAPISLEERTANIYEILDMSAAAIGEELLQAKYDHPGEFIAWVDNHLPFGIDKAERLMAITKAWRATDPDLREALPPKWSALYELSRLPREMLRSLVETKEITPEMTYAEAKRLRQQVAGTPPPMPTLGGVDRAARDLTLMDRGDLSEDMALRVKEWLG